MKKIAFPIMVVFFLLSISCTNTNKDIQNYNSTWDEIINNEKLDYFNKDRFTQDVTLVMEPENIVGIEGVKEYYTNFVTGFSNKEFTIVDIFGEGDKIVKHWNFKGTHTNTFFGIPATGSEINLSGVTLVLMKDGKIAQEQDFFDNQSFLQQMGIVSAPENMSIIQKAYDDFANGDVSSVIGAFDANIVWNEAEGNALAAGNPYLGPDAIMNGIFSKIGEVYSAFKLADIQLHEMSNNQVLATIRYQATIKENNVSYDAQAAHLWTLKNGKITAFQQFVDTKKLNDAFNQ